LAEAKRAYDFAAWISGGPSIRSAQPMGYVAPATDAPRPSTPSSGIDDAVGQPAPFNRPPAFSPPQLPLLAAPRKAQGTYWSLLSPSGALLPITNPSYQPPRAMADIQPAPAPAPSPDVRQQTGTQAWPGEQARSKYWQATHGVDTAPPPAQADNSPWATVDWQHTPFLGPILQMGAALGRSVAQSYAAQQNAPPRAPVQLPGGLARFGRAATAYGQTRGGADLAYGLARGVYDSLDDTARMATTPPPPLPNGAYMDAGGPAQGTADPQEWRAWLTEMRRRADLGPGLAVGLLGGGATFAERGAVGIFGGRLSRTADQSALARAEQMEAAGVDVTKVQRETGWERSANGQWGYEIPDQNSRMIAPVQAGDQPVAIGTRFEHPDFAKGYPDDWGVLKVAPLSDDILRSRPNLGGGYDHGTRTIYLNPNMVPEQQRLIVLHELEHVVQAREGFAPGGSQYMPEVRSAAKASIMKQDAALTQERDGLFAQRDQYIKDQQAARPDAGAPGLETEFWRQNPGLQRRWSDIAHQLEDTDGRIRREMFEQYKRIAGEVQAENVVTRADMDDAERRIRLPRDTAAYPYSEQLVLPPKPSVPQSR
jgi:hypothetical protein